MHRISQKRAGIKGVKHRPNNQILHKEILNKVYSNPKQNMCILCLTEKLWIINFIHENNYLNKKSELMNKCKHINKFL